MWEADESRLGPPSLPGLGNEAMHTQPRGSSAAPCCVPSPVVPHYPGAQRIKLLVVSAALALRRGLPSRDSDGIGILPCMTPLERFLSQTHVIA